MRIYLVLFCFLNLIISVWGETKPPLEPSQESVVEHELIVKTALKRFVLTYGQNKVAIKGYQMDLSLDRVECNAHIIDRFNSEIAQIIKDSLEKGKITHTVQETDKSTVRDTNTDATQGTGQEKDINTLEIQIDGKTYFAKISSPIGQIILRFPEEIVRMKWEEKFNCE